jgi:hypothetical protein
MTAVFPFLPDAESRRRELAIESITLNGETLDARVSMAIKDIPYERTIEGASTVQLLLIDPDGELLDSGLFSAAVDIELPGPSAITPDGGGLPIGSDDPLAYRLVRIKSPDATLTLEFEDALVAAIRSHKEVRHASRADVTRAEFIRMLVRSVTKRAIMFWSPELKTRQPISSVRDMPTRKQKRDEREPGFGSTVPTIKGKPADRTQVGLLELALEVAVQKKANRRVMIGLVIAMTQESVVKNDVGVTSPIPTGGTQLINVGVLHQSSSGWPASRDVPRDVSPFLDRLITVEKQHQEKSIGWCVDQVQRSYTVSTDIQGRDYDQWVDEARETVSAYTGDDPTATRHKQESTYRQRYEFRTSEPGADTREDWWSATGRLAAEVNFRRFIDYGVFHYVSDEYLRRAAPQLTISRKNLPAGVAKVAIGDFDTGKPRRSAQGKNVGGAEVRVDVFTDVLEPPLGGVWVLDGYGPCDGRYLITAVRGSYLSPRATVTLDLPIPKLAEPAPALGTRSDRADPNPGRGPLPNGLTPKQIIDQIVLPIAVANGIKVTRESVEAANARHSTLTTSGNRSDHKGPPNVAWAADMSDNWSATNGSPNMTRLAAALAERFGIDWPGRGLVNKEANGYRYQLIYLTTEGGNHYNHVHFGVKRISGTYGTTPTGHPQQSTSGPRQETTPAPAPARPTQPRTPGTQQPVHRRIRANDPTVAAVLENPKEFTDAQVRAARAFKGSRTEAFHIRIAANGRLH